MFHPHLLYLNSYSWNYNTLIAVPVKKSLKSSSNYCTWNYM